MGPQDKINEALQIARRYGGFQEAHHKSWVIDMMVCILCGDAEAYRKFVADACDVVRTAPKPTPGTLG